MKKLTLLVACIAFIATSCVKKAGFTPDSSISASIDGVAENFNAIDSVGYSNASSMYSMTVSGKNGTSDNSDYIQLNVFSPTPIVPGTYTLSVTNHQAPFYPLILPLPKGSHNLGDDYVVDYTGNHPVTITITALTATSVQGTFSGTLVVAGGS